MSSDAALTFNRRGRVTPPGGATPTWTVNTRRGRGRTGEDGGEELKTGSSLTFNCRGERGSSLKTTPEVSEAFREQRKPHTPTK